MNLRMNYPKINSGPPGHFLLGNLPDFATDILAFFTKCAREYGDFVPIRLAQNRAVIINHPDYIEQVLVTNSRHFRKHRFFWRHVRAIFGEGLLTSEGEYWLRQRRMAQPAFHKERIAAYGKLMVEFVDQLLADWKDGQTRDIHEEMMHVTSRIVTKALFHADVKSARQEINEAFTTAVEEVAIRFRRPFPIPEFLPLPGNIRYRRSVKRLDNLIYRIIQERRSAANSNDLLSMMLEARDEDGTRMSDQQLRDESVTLFLAGHETTAIALTWTFYLLSQHREAQEKLSEELQRVLNGRSPEVSDLPQLRFTEMVLNESMRLYPPAYAFGREATIDTEIGGFPVKKGTTIFMSQWVMHRDQRFFDSPDAFLPERWANGLAKRLPRFAFFPFGGGPRVCIGNSFAILEGILLLARIAQRYKLELVPGQTIEPFPAITLRPKFGMKMRLVQRDVRNTTSNDQLSLTSS
jgi:cytochrome P450